MKLQKYVAIFFPMLIFGFLGAGLKNELKKKKSQKKLKSFVSSKKNVQSFRLSKCGKILQKTVEHPLVYGPPTALLISILEPKLLLGAGLVVASCGGLISTCLPESCSPIKLFIKDDGSFNLIGIAAVGIALACSYLGGCLYAIKKAFDSEKSQPKKSSTN